MTPRRKHKTATGTLGQARRLRRELTPAEKRLWAVLRNHQMFGHKFRRQFPIGSHVVDFCCPARNLVVEIDGDSHAASVEKDAARTRLIEEKGYRVIRFTNSDVHERFAAVTDAILAACEHTGE